MINDQADLKKLLTLLRKQGVTDFEFNGLKLKLGDLPEDHKEILEEPVVDLAIDQLVNMPPEFAGVDPMAFYSAPQRSDQ